MSLVAHEARSGEARGLPTLRRALCIGVGSFTRSGDDEAEEPDLSPFDELEYAADCAAGLHVALEAAGYEAELITDPAKLSAAKLGGHVERYLTGGDVALVHVLSHGDHTDSGAAYVVGSDAARSKRTRVEDWRIAVTDDELAPMTLFLLDLCHAGAANRYWQPPPAGSQEKAWMIAAAGADQPAYAGRLTRAATAVIAEITSGRADLADTLPFVSFDVLFERIRRQVRALALNEGGHPQDPVCTPVMGAQPELPFFPNPNYEPNRAAEAAATVDPATAVFVDPVLDEQHFRDRAAGRGPAAHRFTGGCFTGRVPQLRSLAAWMDSHNDPADPAVSGTGLVVVTGSPGVGKSALLGVLVCAAHPQLREPTRELWRAAAARPSQNPHLAAVHARQRSLAEITASLGRQLLGSEGSQYPGPTRFPGEGAVPAGPRTPPQLIAAITELDVRPVIVLDALDEAPGHHQILDQLLLPLARTHRPDGSPACRLLVGTRPWDELTPLFTLAGDVGEVIDLDSIPTEQRRRDLAVYITSLLELLPGYTSTAHSNGRRAFARGLAETLVADDNRAARTGMEGTDGMRWGEFLVAALYTHTATLSHPDQLADPHAAARLGAAVPRSLPEVLEFDLGTRPASPWRRPLLTVLAHARGAGIPRAVLPTVTAAVTDQLTAPSIEQVTDELEQLRFYLRTSADSDGSALYRLFHQGLADHLRADQDTLNSDAARILDGLLATVPVDDHGRRWDLVAPYLLRHTIQHAATAARVDELLADPGFLVHADPTTLIPTLGLAVAPDARLAAAVYRASGRHQERSVTQRRDVLAIDAARHGALVLCDAICAVPPRARWRPRWATGSQVSSALRATMSTPTESVDEVACSELDGIPIAVTAAEEDDSVRIWDLTTNTQIGSLPAGEIVVSVACTVVDERPIAVVSSSEGTVGTWDLATHKPIGNLTGHLSTARGVSCTFLDGRPVAVTASHDRTVRIWDLITHTPIGNPLTGHSDAVWSVACTVLEGKPVAITLGGEEWVRIWDLTTQTQIGKFADDTSFLHEVACAVVDNRPIAIITGEDGSARIWDLTTQTQIGDLTGHNDAVGAVTCTTLGCHPVAITASEDESVRIWDLTTQTQIGNLTGHTSSVGAVACTVVDSRPVAVTASIDGTVRVWDLTTRMPNDITGHNDTVWAVACTTVDGRPTAVTASDDGTIRVWDLTSHKQIGKPLCNHSGRVRAVACTILDGNPIAVAAFGGKVQSWDLTNHAPMGIIRAPVGTIRYDQYANRVACTTLDDRPIAITTGRDHIMQVWDLAAHTQIGKLIADDTRGSKAVTCTNLGGRPIAIAASDLVVQLWDLTTYAHIGNLIGHTNPVQAVASTMISGRPVAVTTGYDRTVRVWDLATQTQIGNLTGHTEQVDVVACSIIDGRPVAATGGWGATVRIWDLQEQEEVDRIDVPAAVHALSMGPANTIVVGFGWDVMVLEPWTESRR